MSSTSAVFTPSDRTPAAAGSGQFLTFVLAGEHYGVDILRVREIRGWVPVTPIPNAPSYVQGVLNLRGTIVPVFDLRMRFGLPRQEYGATTVVIVLAVTAPAGARRILGVVVDAVSDVFNVPAEEIRPAPDFGSTVRTEFIQGMASIGERLIVLLDTDRLLTIEELHSLNGPAA
jgi:purine-binding chemotaxis protein CheW